jgi:crossover junction endodeoxyribonuclease RuvC
VIRTSPSEPLAIRIREIYDAVVELIDRHRPAAVSVEDVFHGKNAQSALKLGHARGAILLAAAHHDLIIAEYAPRQIKNAVVGTGNATKDQVGFMVKQQLRLKEAPAPADAADGVAAALCHCLIGSFPG